MSIESNDLIAFVGILEVRAVPERKLGSNWRWGGTQDNAQKCSTYSRFCSGGMKYDLESKLVLGWSGILCSCRPTFYVVTYRICTKLCRACLEGLTDHQIDVGREIPHSASIIRLDWTPTSPDHTGLWSPKISGSTWITDSLQTAGGNQPKHFVKPHTYEKIVKSRRSIEALNVPYSEKTA